MSTDDSSTLGERIAEFRRRRDLSQKELGAAVRRSESWVSQVERDVLPVERLSVLQNLADALGVSLRDLKPESADRPTPSDQATATPPASNDLDGLRLTLTGHPALPFLFDPKGSRPTSSLSELRKDVDAAWDLAHESRFGELSDHLDRVLPALEIASRRVAARNRVEVHALLARAYQAAAAAFTRQDEPDAAWIAADRALAAAEHAGDPLSVVAGLFRMAHAFLRLEHDDQAEHVAKTAVAALAPRVADPELCTPETLSLYGAMQLVLAVIAGNAGDRTTARKWLAEAQSTADRLGGDRNDYNTEFGPTNVLLHAVAVAVDLGDAGEALDIAQTVDTSRLSPERQGRFLVDVARAHLQRRRVGEATSALLEAERLTPEHVHSHHLARDAIRDLMKFSGRRAPDELRELAQRAAALP